jgi:hypothetical protein
MDEIKIEKRPYFATLTRHIARLVSSIREHARAGFA